MGSLTNKSKTITSDKKTRIKSKGERLGWKSLSEEKRIPLRERIGEGRIVSQSALSIYYSERYIL